MNNQLYVIEVKDDNTWRIMKGTNHFHIFTTYMQCLRFLNRTWKNEDWRANNNLRVQVYRAAKELDKEIMGNK